MPADAIIEAKEIAKVYESGVKDLVRLYAQN